MGELLTPAFGMIIFSFAVIGKIRCDDRTAAIWFMSNGYQL